MKLTTLFSVLLIAVGSLFAQEEGAPLSAKPKIQWHKQYEYALQEASKSSKPLFILFTGSDWCAWCQKFEQEVLSQPAFAQALSDQYVFLKIDFRLDLKSNTAVFHDYQLLKNRYKAKGFPSVVLINPKEQVIAKTGYQEGGADKYVQHMDALVKDCQEYERAVANFSTENIEVDDLWHLYEKSVALQRESDSERFLNLGVEKDTKGHFLTEKYRLLVDRGELYTEEAKYIRQRLLDPHLELHVNNARFLAVLDFQEKYNQEANSQEILKPLLDFLDKYGEQDAENAWKVHMVISQYYSDVSDFSEAIRYAELAKIQAPEELQFDIEEALRFLREEVEVR